MEKGRETCTTSVSTEPGTFKPRAGDRRTDELQPITVTAPPIVPVDDSDQPFEFKPISFYDLMLRQRNVEEDHPD